MTVESKEQAWIEANKIFPTDYEKDCASSKRAGYDIYRHHTLNYYSRICDLGDRLEVLTGEYGETVVNIWIVAEEEPKQETTETEQPAEPKPEDALMETLNHFIRDRGYEFKTPEELKAGFDRAWKCRCNELITQDEFVAEAGAYFEEATVRDTYNALAAMVESGKLDASDVYRYARFKWCLRNPSAVVAYEYEQRKWAVNNCGTEIAEDEAKTAVNDEWGFDESRVQIIGTPYYDATDWQFIRFDCAHMTWLWKNGNLYQVYE